MTRFAALLEARDLGGNFLQLAQARAGEAVEIEHDHFDAVVVARGTQRIDDVADERLLERRALRLGDRTLERVTGELIDERAARRDDQRRRAGDQDTLADRGDDQQQENAEQQNQVQEAAQSIETTPNPRHDPQRPRTSVPVHSSLPLQGALSIEQH